MKGPGRAPGLRKWAHHTAALREVAFLLQDVPRPLVSTMARASLTRLDLTGVPAWQATPGGTVKTVSVLREGRSHVTWGRWGGLWGLAGVLSLGVRDGLSKVVHDVDKPQPQC